MKLDHFTAEEFREWWPHMAPSALRCFDAFRKHWGARCDVSPHPLALGRRLGPDKMSGHNIDRWGYVFAGDLFPQGMDTPADLERALDCARKAKATGIGLYIDTRPSFMIHLDTRPDRTPDSPRLWCRRKLDGRRHYGAIAEVLPGGAAWSERQAGAQARGTAT